MKKHSINKNSTLRSIRKTAALVSIITFILTSILVVTININSTSETLDIYTDFLAQTCASVFVNIQDDLEKSSTALSSRIAYTGKILDLITFIIIPSTKNYKIINSYPISPSTLRTINNLITTSIPRRIKDRKTFYEIFTENGEKKIVFIQAFNLTRYREVYIGVIKNLHIDFKITETILSVFTYISFLIGVILLLIKTESHTKTMLSNLEKTINDALIFGKKDFETKNISDAVKEMVQRIVKRINIFQQSIEEERQELRYLIKAISEGIVILDDRGEVVMYNNVFRSMIDTPVKIGMHFTEVFYQFQDMNHIIDQVFKEESSSKTLMGTTFVKKENSELYLEYRVFQAPELKRIMIILYDVTKFVESEKMKTEFLANISHELKTPLSAIKGFTETLIETDMDEKTRNKFLGIIHRHTERLIHLVKDLSTLTHLESGGVTLRKESIYIPNLVNDIVPLFHQKASEKNISLETDIDKIHFTTDPMLVSQLIINLLDNAIKYTNQGFVSLSIKGNKHRHLVVTVQDTGIGIPKSEQEKIFDRFYRVDKSRVRKTGGTGLGLSIVSKIVKILHGNIHLTSEPDQGTTITVEIPE